MLYADGFDEAILGIGTQFNTTYVVYDQEKCIDILNRDMSREDAVEFFVVNVLGSYVGEGTPVFLERLTRREIDEFVDEE